MYITINCGNCFILDFSMADIEQRLSLYEESIDTFYEEMQRNLTVFEKIKENYKIVQQIREQIQEQIKQDIEGKLLVCLFVLLLLYVPSPQLWSWRDSQFT